MISKSELLNKSNELEAKLQLIYKYAPSFRNIEENVRVLQSMGLSDFKIEEAISSKSTCVVSSLINPLNGEEMSVYVEDISIREDLNTGEYVVFVGAFPYKDFFAQALMTTRKLEELSKNNPEIKALYDENRRLKKSLALICRK